MEQSIIFSTDAEIEVGVPYPVKFRPILSGKILPDLKRGKFIVELATLKFHRDETMLDYNHDEGEIIGLVDTETYRIGPDGWIGDGFLVSLEEGDRAWKIAKLGRVKVKDKNLRFPWEVSPTLELDEGDEETVPQGTVVNINGFEQVNPDGPLKIYRNVPVRGLSICPYARDKDTNAFLKMERLNHQPTQTEVKKMSEEDKKDQLNQQEEPKVRDDVLLKFTNRFGAERGCKLFQEGVDYDKIDEAFQTLKSCGFTTLDAENKDELNTDGNPEEPPKGAEEPEKLNDEKKPDTLNTDEKEEFKRLRSQVKTLTGKVDKMSIQRRGETEPISRSPQNDRTEKPSSFSEQIQSRYKK